MKQSRFTTQFEIEVEINKVKRAMMALEREAEEQDRHHDDLIRAANNPMHNANQRALFLESAHYAKEKADRLWRKVKRINEIKIESLKQAMSAFQTGTLPFTQDKGVVLT